MEIKKCYIAITPTSPGSTDKFHNIVHAFSQGNYFLAAAVVCTLLFFIGWTISDEKDHFFFFALYPAYIMGKTHKQPH